MSGVIFSRTVPNVMEYFHCTAEDAQRFIDMREEGYSFLQAAVQSGLADPPHVDDEPGDES